VITHLACIMDGNRRWAKQNGLAPWLGHREGIKAVERTIDFCLSQRIPHLTLYTFSVENLKRPEDEKNYLFNVLMTEMQERLTKQLQQKGVRFRIRGDRRLFPEAVIQKADAMERDTAHGPHLQINALFCYGGQYEIAMAAQKIAQDVQAGVIDIDAISPHLFSRYLSLEEVPDPDLIIRTGGAQRLSNFLLFQAAYSELYFVDTLWPDFSADHLHQAMDYFNNCRRNFGR
jgi:undecaprenyl diphosphate synthase